MALQDLYGIGKGEAQVLDNQPMLDLLAEERAANRKLYAEKIAKKATQKAAIDASAKLAVEGFYKDNEYLTNHLRANVSEKMVANMSKYGENAYVDNPALKQELDQSIRDFTDLNARSKNYKEIAMKQIEMAKGTDEDMDEASIVKFNDWMALPPEQRMFTEIPLISKRELSSFESLSKNHSQVLGKQMKKTGSTGIPNPATGRLVTTEGEIYDEIGLNDFADDLLNNRNSITARKYYKDAATDVLAAGVIGQYTMDGKENPKFSDAVNKLAKETLLSDSKKLAGSEWKKSHATYIKDGSGDEDKDKENIVTPVRPEDSGVRKEATPDLVKQSKHISNVYSDGLGGKYMKLKESWIQDVNGNWRTEAEFNKLGLTKKQKTVSAGSIVDKSFKKVEAKEAAKLNEIHQVNVNNTGTSYSVKIEGEKSNLSGMKYVIGTDGKKVDMNLTQGVSDATIDNLTTDAKYKEINDYIYFENEKEFKADTKTEVKVGDFAVVKQKNSKNYLTTPVTEEMLNKNPKFATHYNEIKGGGEGSPKKGDVVDGYEFQGGDPANQNNWKKQ